MIFGVFTFKISEFNITKLFVRAPLHFIHKQYWYLSLVWYRCVCFETYCQGLH